VPHGDDLLLDLQKRFHVYGSAKNIAITVSGHFHTTFRDLINSALNITERWCKTNSNGKSAKDQYYGLHQEIQPEPRQSQKLRVKKICSVKYVIVLLHPKLNWENTSHRGGRKFAPLCGHIEEPGENLAKLNPK
jgi:hypothetical protein